MQDFVEFCESEYPSVSVLLDEPMSKHTTFRIGGPADAYVEVDTKSAIGIIAYCKSHMIPYTIIGNGSNVLVSDAGVSGVVISFGNTDADVVVDNGCIKAESGALLSRIANIALENGLTGFEWASGIPGSIGGALVMNAGAYGGEMKDVIVSATIMQQDGDIEELGPEELDLSYRHSCIPDRQYTVLDVTIRLEAGDKEQIQAKMNDYKEQRLAKQPVDKPSAGSTFKRPEGFFAAALIDEAGMRGEAIGGARVSDKHTGFVINDGGATCDDVLSLMGLIKETVYGTSGVMLEPEVKIIGRF